jgi:D-aspartate ligase
MRVAQPGALVLGSDFKALGVVRSLGRRGIPCALVDSLPRSAWFSRYVGGRYRWRGNMCGPAFLDFLLGLADQEGLAGWMLMPAQDEAVELVAQEWERLSATYRLVTQPWERLRWAHDKRLLNLAADEAGVAHPRTWYPRDEDELQQLDVLFPAIIKPASSIDLQYSLGRKALPARDRGQLAAGYRAAAQVVPAEQIMVQEIIPATGQYSVAAFCVEGRISSAMTARRTRQFPIDYGLSSSFVESVEMPGLIAMAQKLLSRLRLTGMVEVEFITDRRDGEPKLLDVNPRPWGWHTLCIASGLDFPLMTYELAHGRLPAAAEPLYGLRWIRLLTDAPAGLQAIRAGVVSPGDYMRSLWGRNVFSVLDFRDPLPAVGDLAVALHRIIRSAANGRGLHDLSAHPGPARAEKVAV